MGSSSVVCGVGGIIVHYRTHLQSLVSGVRAYHQDSMKICISPYIYSKTQKEYWIFKSVPKLVDVISLNPVNSGDSNGGIQASIPTLGAENRNLLSFCLPALPW